MATLVPFNQLRYGTRFKYREEDTSVFVRLGHDLVADWDGKLYAVACNRQGLYCFEDDTTPFDTPVYVVADSEPVPTAGGEPEVYKAGVHFPDKYLPHVEDVVLLADHQAHVTRLQAEVERLKEAQAEQDNSSSDRQFYTKQLHARAAKVLNLDGDNTSWFEIVDKVEVLQAELTKARGALLRILNASEWTRDDAHYREVAQTIADKATANQSAPAEPKTDVCPECQGKGEIFCHDIEDGWYEPCKACKPTDKEKQ